MSNALIFNGYLYGCLQNDQRMFHLLKKRIPVSPRYVSDGAVVLVAPGVKGFFEPCLGSGGKLRVPSCVGLRCQSPHGLP
jgi:hypothetical protein